MGEGKSDEEGMWDYCDGDFELKLRDHWGDMQIDSTSPDIGDDWPGFAAALETSVAAADSYAANVIGGAFATWWDARTTAWKSAQRTAVIYLRS